MIVPRNNNAIAVNSALNSIQNKSEMLNNRIIDDHAIDGDDDNDDNDEINDNDAIENISSTVNCNIRNASMF